MRKNNLSQNKKIEMITNKCQININKRLKNWFNFRI